MVHNSKKTLGAGWRDIVGVKRLVFYGNDVQVEYMVRTGVSDHERAKRTNVIEFTRKSRERLAFVANNTSIEFSHMITLTYPREYETDGKIVKKHLNRFLSWIRGYAPGVNYLWFIEFQSRGAPHFHILLDVGVSKDKVSKMWYKHVNSGDEKHLAAGTRVERIRKRDGARRYGLKYAFKMQQKIVPSNYSNVGRFWGHSKSVKPSPVYSTEDLGISPEGFVDSLSFWEYSGAIGKRPLKTLYGMSGNAGEILREMHKDE